MFDRTNQPPATFGTPLWCGILRIKGSTASVLTPIGLPHGLMMHWIPELHRTQPCIIGQCAGCVAGHPTRPLAYMAVLLCKHGSDGFYWQPRVLEVPHS